MHRKQLLAI